MKFLSIKSVTLQQCTLPHRDDDILLEVNGRKCFLVYKTREIYKRLQKYREIYNIQNLIKNDGISKY